jgi:diguanylate cyclase (GGDEF)-like protein/putative nucleotidyltransferase with HDIG domain
MKSDTLNNWVRPYTNGLIGLGAVVIGYAALGHPAWLDARWLLLALVTAIVSMRVAIPIPTVKSEVTVYDTFVFIALFMYGTEAGTLLAAVAGYGASVRCARTARSYAINTATVALSVFVAAKSSRLLLGHPLYELATRPDLTGKFILALGLVALLYYVVNTVAIAVVITMRTGEPLHRVWANDFLWSAVSYFAGAFAAGLTLVVTRVAGGYGLFTLLPALALTYISYRKFFDKVEASNRHVRSLADLHLKTIEALAMAIDAKDRVSRGHVRRVQITALEIAREMGLRDESLLEALRAGALLHDIGKLAVPDHILNKPGELTAAEFAKVAVHPEIGAHILSRVEFPYPVVPIIRHHHERWDGQGYPQKLRGEEIPLGARILAVADNYDALRVNRNAPGTAAPDSVLAELRARAGSMLDPQAVEACCRAAGRIEGQLSQALIPKLELEAEAETSEARTTRKLADVYQDIADAHREVLALYELSQTLASSSSLEALLETLANRVMRDVRADACALFLAEASREKVRVVCAAGRHREDLEGKFIAWGYGLSGWAAANKAPMINARANLDFPFLNSSLQATAFPLVYQGRALGVITFYVAERGYDADEIRLIESFAHHAAVALNNVLTLEETRENAFTDQLTGLPNARHLSKMIEEFDAGDDAQTLTLLMLDLDGFKAVNDTFGHHLGDELLRRVGALLRENLRVNDTLVRYGGDEFIGVLHEASPPLVQQLILQLQRAVEGFELPVTAGRVARVGVSIGQAIFPKDGRTVEQLLVAADQRMYLNKRERKLKRAASKVLEFPTGTDGLN